MCISDRTANGRKRTLRRRNSASPMATTCLFSTSTTTTIKEPKFPSVDMNDKNWAWSNYLSAHALAQADNVRAQLERVMECYEIELVTTQDERKFYQNVRMALVCGYFMQVAHKEGQKGSYLTVKRAARVAARVHADVLRLVLLPRRRGEAHARARAEKAYGQGN
ncbi:hypothetical protein DFH11DRAFT_1316954 [Phellopilus nigrolimitatus]|nr:hypothetical protein DFH11DRAFT_1316954 [Phellopilus nigrolimitatus]